ncbi:hypothetical protein VYU27_010681 [Nannochloropsis oceanica]
MSMPWRSATKAGAMAWRGGAFPGPGKGRALRGAFLSTTHTGTGNTGGSGSMRLLRGSFDINALAATVGVTIAVITSTAVAVHHYDENMSALKLKAEVARMQDMAAKEVTQAKAEVARMQDMAAKEVAHAKAEFARMQDMAAKEVTQAKAEVARMQDMATTEVARVKGERELAEQMWKNEVERHKRDVQLAYTQDYTPYQAAISKGNDRRTGTGGPQKDEEKKG